MLLRLVREIFTAESTIGTMWIGDEWQCRTLEDYERLPGMPKVPGRTAIPHGVYTLRLTYSRRFGVELPELVDVPGFSGIRIHAGNTAEDTAGCILTGDNVTHNAVLRSKPALASLMVRLRFENARGVAMRIQIGGPWTWMN